MRASEWKKMKKKRVAVSGKEDVNASEQGQQLGVWALGSNTAPSVALPCLIYTMWVNCSSATTVWQGFLERTGTSCPLVYSTKPSGESPGSYNQLAGLQVTKSSERTGLDLFQVSSVRRFSAPGWMTYLLFALGGLSCAKRPTFTLLAWLWRSGAD